jgi:hypothetical protein
VVKRFVCLDRHVDAPQRPTVASVRARLRAVPPRRVSGSPTTRAGAFRELRHALEAYSPAARRPPRGAIVPSVGDREPVRGP